MTPNRPEAGKNMNEADWITKLRQELMLSKMTHSFTFSRDEVIELLSASKPAVAQEPIGWLVRGETTHLYFDAPNKPGFVVINGNDPVVSIDPHYASPAAPAQSAEPVVGSPAFALRGLYKLAMEYFIDGKPCTPDEYITWQAGIIEAITKAKLPDPKYYGGSAEEGSQHEVKCAYVDGWNDCRASILATPQPAADAPGMAEPVAFVFPPMPPALVMHDTLGPLFDRLSMQFYADKCMRIAASPTAVVLEFKWPPLPALPVPFLNSSKSGAVFTEHQMQAYANAYGEAVRAAKYPKVAGLTEREQFIRNLGYAEGLEAGAQPVEQTRALTEKEIIDVLPVDCSKVYGDFERGYNKALSHAREKIHAALTAARPASGETE